MNPVVFQYPSAKELLEFAPAGASAIPFEIGTKYAEPTIVHCVNAQLPVLPDPLRLLHGPLLATVETWSDGSVVARIPSLALYAAEESDTLALAELAEEVLAFATDVFKMLANHEEIAGPLDYQWRALIAMVDVSGLSK